MGVGYSCTYLLLSGRESSPRVQILWGGGEQLYLPPVVWEGELPPGTDIAGDGGGEQLYLPPVVWERELPPGTDIAGGGEEKILQSLLHRKFTGAVLQFQGQPIKVKPHTERLLVYKACDKAKMETNVYK